MIRFIPSMTLLCAFACLQAAGAATPEQMLQACRAISDAAARLRCYDDVADFPRGEPSAPPSNGSASQTASERVAPPAVTSSAVPEAVNGSFGAESLPPPRPAEPKALVAHVAGKIDGVRRGMTVQLDNGQTWRVVDDREYDYIGDAPEVRLDRNFVGTYWMEIAGEGLRFKVRRVK